MPEPALKSLPAFEALTSAEAAVFEPHLRERTYRAREELKPEGDLLIVSQGSIGLSVLDQGGKLPFSRLDSGEILGELDFFEPEPVPILAEAEADTVCYAVDRRTLKHSFRYSRTGAMKFMIIFARGLSRKLRSANELLNQSLAGGSGSGSDAFRPSQLEEHDLQRLQSLCVSRSFPADTAIFREGEPGAELFVIGEGEVEIVKEAASGQSLSLARLGPGDFFGEMAFVDQRPRSATAIARGPLQVSVLPSGALERVIESHLGTALYLSNVLCKIMARRLNVTLKRISAL